MTKFYTAQVKSTQTWIYQYDNIEADSQEEANLRAIDLYIEGVESNDNWMDEDQTSTQEI